MNSSTENRINAFARIEIPTATPQQKGLMVVGGRPRYYTKGKVKSAMSLYWAVILSGRPRGFKPFEGPVRVMVTFCFAAPKSWSKKARAAITPKTTRPDLDNMAKTVLDAATRAHVWRDDAQVTRLDLRKAYGPEEFVRIVIEEDAEAQNMEESQQ